MANMRTSYNLIRIIRSQAKKLQKNEILIKNLIHNFALSKNSRGLYCEPCIKHMCGPCLSIVFDFDIKTFEYKLHETSRLCGECERIICQRCEVEFLMSQHEFTINDYNFNIIESNGPHF
jgi:hypothetical protein